MPIRAINMSLPDAKTTCPTDPPSLERSASESDEEGHANASDAETLATDPAASGVQLRSDRCTRQLSKEGEDHEAGIDSVAAFGLHGVDGGSVRYLRGLHTEVQEERLDDGASDGEGACIRAHAYAD